MDRSMQLQHLAQAEQHIARGAEQIRDQEARVIDLERRGQDASLSRAVLETFRSIQAQHVAHRDHILTELGR
jgi:hypothetical protein